MTVSEVITVVFGIVTALIALAALKAEQRTWLKRLSSKLAFAAFIMIGIANSVFGIYSFVVATTPPTRPEIAFLMLVGFNLVMLPYLALDSWSGSKVRASQERLQKALDKSLSSASE